MNQKLAARVRRAKKARIKIKKLCVPRLCVHRTSQHIYAQIIAADGKILVSAASVGKAFKEENKITGNIAAAQKIGQLVAQRAKEQGIDKVAFDRSGFRYHGRVKALAETARENGLIF